MSKSDVDPEFSGQVGRREPFTKRTAEVALLVVLLALAFQGSRGLWEPDEGFYANVALNMLTTRDWVVPRLNGEPFLDKPPLLYWGMVSGMALLGTNEWGIRIAHAFFFMATALLVGLIGRDLWGLATGRAAALIYATSLLPFVAGNVATPDTPLAACTTLAYFSYLRAERGGSSRRRTLWWLVLGAAVGLGLLAKGPAMLIFLPPIAIDLGLRRRVAGVLREGNVLLAAAVALVLGLSWYLFIFSRLPTAWSYVLDNQVVGRLVTDKYRRNPGWRGIWRVYLTTLLFGSLPWSFFWGPALWRLRRKGHGHRALEALRRDPSVRLVTLWTVLPFLVLAAAQSRLPLYVLPLCAPIALASGRYLLPLIESFCAFSGECRRLVWLAVWCILLLLLKGSAGSRLSPDIDSRRFARSLRQHIGPAATVVAVDVNRNALPFYGFRDFEWVTTSANPYPFFTRTKDVCEAVQELTTSLHHHVFLLSPSNAESVHRLLTQAGVYCVPRKMTGYPPMLICSGPNSGQGNDVVALPTEVDRRPQEGHRHDAGGGVTAP